jgi:hypothetical protein
MAVVNTKSTAITNADATPVVITNRALIKGPVFSACGTVEVAAADDNNSVYRMARIPSNARILSLVAFNDAITLAAGATSFDLGLHQTAANGGAVADSDAFASAVNFQAASTAGTELRYEAANIDGIEKRLWELLGLTSDSQREYDVAFTGISVGDVAGTISLEILWTV